MKLLNAVMKSSHQTRYANANRALLHFLAWRGGKLFGQVPDAVRREFFCLDPHTWVWHEEWTDRAGQHHAVTTRYDINRQGILKSQGVNSYQRLSEQEERNFRAAAKQYIANSRAELRRLAAA